jgi:ribonuclease HI
VAANQFSETFVRDRQICVTNLVDQVRYVAGVADQAAVRTVDIYTDGACSGNPGPGGWGVVLRYGTREKETYGGEPAETTNNRMELMAPIRALESLTRPVVVRLYTDSKYVLDGITKWLPRWKSNGWQTTGKQEANLGRD